MFDEDGNLIGIVVSSLSAEYAKAKALPQNVDYAIKSDYVINLVSMLPDVELEEETVAFSADDASNCVVAIRATK